MVNLEEIRKLTGIGVGGKKAGLPLVENSEAVFSAKELQTAASVSIGTAHKNIKKLIAAGRVRQVRVMRENKKGDKIVVAAYELLPETVVDESPEPTLETSEPTLETAA